ncbi:MAG: isochorismate synthase [Rubrobacteraceae bacterium]
MSRDQRSLVPDEEASRFRGTPDHVRWTLADLASRALSSEPGLKESGLRDAEPRVARIELPVVQLDPMSWLRNQRLGSKSYWSGREDGMEVAAVGVADLHEGSIAEDAADLRKRLAPLLSSGDPRLRYYGGLRFDPTKENDAGWQPFGSFRFSLPRFELISRRGDATLACNLVLPHDTDRREEILEEIEQLSFERENLEEGLPEPISRADVPDFAGWRRNIDQTLADFYEGRLEKAVLARRTTLEFTDELDPTLLARKLKDATPDCFHFYFEPEDGTAFIGASPERLFRREGNTVLSEAVAGTRPRGTSELDDQDLREELLNSEKDRSEHEYVRVSIREALAPLCDELEVEERASEMKLTRRRHMVSGVRGTLRKNVSDAEILDALHPTPAVGGYPREEALEEIRALESFDRGWYAGPVGWIGADSAEFAVGIRSGLVSGREISLFSGAGIVAGSTAENEWAEIEQKIGDFTRILGLEPGKRQS